MRPHFYNLRSRLGMINVPHRMKALNLGVEYGGDAILTSKFLKNFPQSPVDTFDFPLPETVDRAKYYDVQAESLNFAEKFISKSLKKDEIQVVVGGDNSVSFAALASMMKKVKPTWLGCIRIDSHPDMNNIASTPSGNFHGMWMRPFVDGFENINIAKLVPGKLSLNQLLFIGNLDINPGERRFFGSGRARVISPKDLKRNKKEAQELISRFIKYFDFIYLAVDIDGFDHSIAPATGIPAKDGVFVEDLKILFDEIKKKKFSVDLVELNPKKPGAEKTVKLAQDILLRLLG